MLTKHRPAQENEIHIKAQYFIVSGLIKIDKYPKSNIQKKCYDSK